MDFPVIALQQVRFRTEKDVGFPWLMAIFGIAALSDSKPPRLRENPLGAGSRIGPGLAKC
jgi:hypothetical protein